MSGHRVSTCDIACQPRFLEESGCIQLPGTYSVSITKDGFSPQQQTGITLAAGQVQTLRVSLPIGAVATTVEVSADLPVIETGRTNAYNNVYTSREVQNVPVPGRSFLDLFVVNPIVNAPPLSTGGSGTGTPSVSFGGLGFRAINVDGVSNNVQDGARNLVISEDALSEVKVVTNYSAEFGRAAALQLNAISKSGSNDLHYSGFLFARNKALSARPFLLNDTTPTPPFSRYNYGGTASGPLKKDRAFIFGSYERWQQDVPQVSTFGGAVRRRPRPQPHSASPRQTLHRSTAASVHTPSPSSPTSS